MATRLFLTEARLEAWIADGRAEIRDGNLLRLDGGAEVTLESAAHVLALVEGLDERGWLGKVKSEAFLRDAQAELLGETMVVGETAYEIVPGFLIETELDEEALESTQSFLE